MVVADAEGVEIDCDEFGRILVHFHWDLEKGGKSMRCRVSQNWSHQGYGGMIIPRVGMEVIVDFLEGDPDKPIVTGCVYNGKNKPYYELPENKTRSVFRTDTHQGEGFNELRIEDEKGKEEIFWHAQKDRTVKVLNDNTERVDRNEVTSVGRNRFAEVAGLENLYVGGNMKVTVSGTVTENYATGDLKTNWEGIRALGEDLDEEPKGPGDYTMDVANNITVTAGKDQSIAIAKNRTMTVGKDMSTSVGKNSVLNVSEQSTISVGTKMATDVGDEIVFKCGNASLVMKRNGDIILKGTNISIEGSGKITAKASATMTLKGATISQN
jgi:type VI secretion system secreted protein VgrG